MESAQTSRFQARVNDNAVQVAGFLLPYGWLQVNTLNRKEIEEEKNIKLWKVSQFKYNCDFLLFNVITLPNKKSNDSACY